MARTWAERCPKGHSRVSIKYFVVPNTNKHRGGFCPVYRINRQRMYNSPKLNVHGDTYCRGYDHGVALQHARAMAQDEASRYLGDWCVTVERSVRGTRGITDEHGRFVGRRRR